VIDGEGIKGERNVRLSHVCKSALTRPLPQAGEVSWCRAGPVSSGVCRSVNIIASERLGFGWRSRPVSRVLSWTVIPLGATSPLRSSNLPGPDAGHVMRSLFGLAPGGVCRAGLLPGSRCALTAPFHPCHARSHPPLRSWTPWRQRSRADAKRRSRTSTRLAVTGWCERRSAVSFCCTFRRLAPPRRYLAPCPVEPGLSSASAAIEMDANDATVWPTPPPSVSHACRRQRTWA